jgi:hypothetical protein
VAVPHFIWTDHALRRLDERGLTRERIAAAIRDGHPIRERNDGVADWRVDGGRFVVVYDHPVGDDYGAVRVVSVWRKRRPNR